MFENQSVQRLLKFAGVLVAVLVVYVAVLALNALKENKYIGGGVSAANVITVSGEGEAFAVPDIAELTFEVVSEKATLTAAQDDATTKMNAILAYLEKQEIEDRDIKTTNYSANPRYEWRDTMPIGAPTPAIMMDGGSAGSDATVVYPSYGGNGTQVLVGYDVRHSVSVKVRDTEKAGTILAGVGELGATNMYGPNFTVDDEDELMREARKDAIRDAEEKAHELAKELGVKIVRVVTFSESGNGYYPMYRDMVASYDAGMEVKVVPELAPGENKITANVSITYEIR